ncbi:hypothetical protein BN1723_000216 [Verticillium longisporum]|uniref:USP domain-containing protein n=1 Tax=Verticillium longisporum TaxID=100787 RepID=A0A0G4KEW7_VERLO|nr:hypothetical protein BN1723_000216 [Verticillium longisporum]
MANRQPYKTTFNADKVIRPIFTGGSVALDNGARVLATALGEDAVLTDPSNGRHLAQIEGDGEQISTLTLTPNASHLIICSRSLSMKIYALKSAEDDSITPTLVRSLKPHGTPVVVLAVDRTSTLLATGGTDGAIKVWDIAGGYVTHTFRGPSVLVSALKFFEVAARAKETDTGKKSKKARQGDEEEEEEVKVGTTQFRLISDEDHHVYINMQTQNVYVLPEGYEVKSKSLDDIKYVSDPRYTKQEVMELDRRAQPAWTLAGKEYAPGFVGMNNLKENDYLNVILQALSHVVPLRNYFLLENFSSRSELAKRTSILVRKIWNPRAFKAHVSPHELLQQIALDSNKRFTLTNQSDPIEFLSWFLNNLHLGLGGSKTKPGSSMIHRIFQGKLKVESQAITARADAGDRLRFEDAADVHVAVSRFLLLTLDLPAAPLFQDENNRNIIPQVPLTTILAKYDGRHAQEHLAQRKRYRLLHPLPPYLVMHVKRFSQNKFVSERNPTIVTFDARNLDMAPYVEPNPAEHPPGEPIWYDLVANVVHEAVRARREDVADAVGEERKTWKVQLKDKGRDEWVVCQDLFVDKVQSELLYLGETYLQVWERRRTPKGKARA